MVQWKMHAGENDRAGWLIIWQQGEGSLLPSPNLITDPARLGEKNHLVYHFLEEFTLGSKDQRVNFLGVTYIVCAVVVLLCWAQSCWTLWDPMDCSSPGSSVRGIFHAIILEWLALPPPRDLADPEIELMCLTSPALTGGFFNHSAT